MNVKWRGKTYCGAFIDIEKHNWQPPRLGDAAPSEVDHFTRGRNKRSLNSESEKGEEDTPSKRGRNKGKKKRGTSTSQIKKVKKTESGAVTDDVALRTTTPSPSSDKVLTGGESKEQQPVPSEPVTGAASDDVTEDKTELPKQENCEVPEEKSEDKAEAAVCLPDKEPTSEVPPAATPPAPTTPISTLPVSALHTPSSQPGGAPLPTAVLLTPSQQSTPVSSMTTPTLPTFSNASQDVAVERQPDDPVTSQSVINCYSPHSKKVKNANKLTPIPKEMYGPDSVIKTFNSPLGMPPMKPFSPRSLGGYVVPNQEMMAQGDISSSKPQVIVKPERRDLQWSKHGNLPVLKPQPHFTSHENNLPVHALASINHQLFKDQQLQQQQQQLKKNEQFLSFKSSEQMGHAFKNASLFSKPSMPNISNANEQHTAFANLHRHFYPQSGGPDKSENMMNSAPEQHRPSQEAAHSLLQLARPFSSKSSNPTLDQLQYFSRFNNMPVISSAAAGAAQPPTFPPPRFPTENKEELAKLMAFPNVGPKFPIPQVGKFR